MDIRFVPPRDKAETTRDCRVRLSPTTGGTFTTSLKRLSPGTRPLSIETMPVRRRHDPCARDGSPRWRVDASLIALSALAVARHWVGVEGFVPAGTGGVIDLPPRPRSKAASARAPVRPRRSAGRCRRGVLGGVRGMCLGLALRASLGDEDAFDTVSVSLFFATSLIFEKNHVTCLRQHSGDV